MHATLQAERLQPEDEVDIARSRLYALLALGFSFPGPELVRSQGELWTLGRTLYPELLPDDKTPRVTLRELEPLYINGFDGVDRKTYCKPYEGLWYDSDRAKRQWEVKRFYAFFGLAPDAVANDMPDHIAAELEFMHVLACRSVEARELAGETAGRKDPNGPRHYLQAQRDFLERHLAQWLPGLHRRLIETEAHPFYLQLAALAEQFVKDDLAWLCERLRPPASVA